MHQHSALHTSLSRRTLLWRSLGAGSGALLVAACSGLRAPSQPLVQPTTSSRSRRGGALRISQPTDIAPVVIPHLVVPQNFVLYPLMYDTLLTYDAQLQPQPRLATGWQWSADARQITLQLRPGVKFHSGKPFTSAEVKANLEHLRNPAVGSEWMSYANQMHIDAPDPGTLVISFDMPNKSSLDALANTFMSDPATLGTNTFVGTGPFRFQEWVQGDHLTFVRNPAHWQSGKPYLDQVTLQIQPDPQTSVVAMESGSLDWVIGVAAEDARRLQADHAYQVLLNASGGNLFFMVGVDTNVPALADKRVRQAFSYAVNRQRMVDAALAGYGRPASIIWPPQSLAYDAGLDQSRAYDLDKARQLLNEAGWDPSTRVALRVGADLPAPAVMAQIYQGDLNAIGVNVSLEQKSTQEMLVLLQKRQVGGAWISPTNLMNFSPATFFTSNAFARVPNPSNFTSDQYTSLVGQATAATDDQTLKTVAHDLTQLMLDESFFIPIAQSQFAGLGVARTTVKDVAWDSTSMYKFQDVWLAA